MSKNQLYDAEQYAITSLNMSHPVSLHNILNNVLSYTFIVP